MMVTVLIYTYATCVFSSRRIARKLHEDVAFHMLCGGSFPRHRTICEFRRRHLSDFWHLFLEVVRIAREAGMVCLGTLATTPCVQIPHRARSAKIRQCQPRLMVSPKARNEQKGTLDHSELLDT